MTITLAVDFGASSLRAILTRESFKPELLLMEPQVSPVTKESLEDYTKFRIGLTSPENSAYVEYKGEFYAVGNLAKNRFRGGLQLEKRKFELALHKLLALVGVISQMHQLPNGIEINLGIVLPYKEFRDRDYFESLLREALTGYKFCGVEKFFTLQTFICLPEGGGVLSQAREPGSSFKDLEIIVLMIGFRDVSLLFVDRGEMSRGETEPLGFARLVSLVAEKTSLHDYPSLTKAICLSGKNLNSRALMPLVKNVGQNYRQHELSRIKQALVESKNQYWMDLKHWLQPRVKQGADEIIVSGGTAQFFKVELGTFLRGNKVLWCDELEKRITKTFSEQVTANSLQYRLADVYGLFFFLYNRLAKERGDSKKKVVNDEMGKAQAAVSTKTAVNEAVVAETTN